MADKVGLGSSAMTRTLVKCRIGAAGMRSASQWSQVAAVASALLLGVSSPSRADMGSFFGGMAAGIIGQAMQQPQPQPYYPAPQYYQQPQYQQHPNAASAEARR